MNANVQDSKKPVINAVRLDVEGKPFIVAALGPSHFRSFLPLSDTGIKPTVETVIKAFNKEHGTNLKHLSEKVLDKVLEIQEIYLELTKNIPGVCVGYDGDLFYLRRRDGVGSSVGAGVAVQASEEDARKLGVRIVDFTAKNKNL